MRIPIVTTSTEEDVASDVDGVSADSGVGVVEEAAGGVGCKFVAIPGSGGVAVGRNGRAVKTGAAGNGKEVAVGSFIVEDVGVEEVYQIVAAAYAPEEAGKGGAILKNLTLFVIDFKSDINDCDEVGGANGQFGVRGDGSLGGAGAAVADVGAGEAGFEDDTFQGVGGFLNVIVGTCVGQLFQEFGFFFRRQERFLLFEVNFAVYPLVVEAVAGIGFEGQLGEVYGAACDRFVEDDFGDLYRRCGLLAFAVVDYWRESLESG
jgi:hypothetical protein